MARSHSSRNAAYDIHPGDASRKGYQRQVNKRFRSETRQALRLEHDAMPVVRRAVDRLAH